MESENRAKLGEQLAAEFVINPTAAQHLYLAVVASTILLNIFRPNCGERLHGLDILVLGKAFPSPDPNEVLLTVMIAIQLLSPE
ncbi:hypothetical protein RRG08_014077 [Elysia crispata]|uniref:Uncharacterized protein n=1 Tax=Elysia crispata TaxID=231223 RepID=A0AAE0ZZR1_9GAST|nr:hypothetical protein RRG08_014077 [Elysia crispata]